MGLQVVGRLAARHGVAVELAPGHEGLTAYVTIPPDLVVEDVPQQGRVPTPKPRPKPMSEATPAATTSGLPIRTPGRPMTPAFGTAMPGMFTAPDVPQDRASANARVPRQEPRRPVAEAGIEAVRGPIFRLTDPDSGHSRHYRPITINWAARNAQSADQRPDDEQ
jgi:hypothetical protein